MTIEHTVTIAVVAAVVKVLEPLKQALVRLEGKVDNVSYGQVLTDGKVLPNMAILKHEQQNISDMMLPVVNSLKEIKDGIKQLNHNKHDEYEVNVHFF
jgi:hypothetical protein